MRLQDRTQSALRTTCAATLAWLALTMAACGTEAAPIGSDAGHEGGVVDDARAICATAADCDDGRFCNGAELCEPSSTAADARGCVPAALPCGTDGCDESADTCTGPCATADGDADGVRAATCGGTDCDDADAARFPGNVEVCDAADHDEDCNATTVGDLDADGDGLVDRACCNDRDGLPFCGTDCDDSAAGVFPGATEVCNGRDDDCNVLVDDVNPGVVLCTSGASIACATSCGLVGTAPCRADCLGYDTCVADEICNGCDDDDDGSFDEGYECARGATVVCETACGTTGQRICAPSCAYETPCAATAEICNFCDDNVSNGILDEKVLATNSVVDVPLHMGRYAGVAASDGIGSGPIDIYARLLDGTATDTAGAYWVEVPRFVGWGTIRIDATLEARVVPPAAPAPDAVLMPLGGWSVVLSTGGMGDVGPPQNRGVPSTLQGVSFDWFWSTFGFFSPTPYGGDSMRYRSLTRGPRGTYPSDADGDDIVNDTADLDTGDTSFVTQAVVVEYTPDDPSTPLPVNEERVDFTANGMTRTYVPVPPLPSSVTGPTNDLPVGSTLRIGFTAGTFSRVLSPGGSPLTFGVPVEARLRLETISFGSMGAVFHTYHSVFSEAGVCPGAI